MNTLEKKVRVGIPRALLYHKYGKMWENFFRGLGAQVITSPETNKETVARGGRLSIDESCLSVKIFTGHLDWLRDKCDVVFIPNVACLHRNEEMCVKFMALVDIARNIFPEMKIIEYTVNAENFQTEAMGMFKAGMAVTRDPLRVIRSYLSAKAEWRRAIREKNAAQEDKIKEVKENDKLAILVVSHPYTTYDNFLGKPIIDGLGKLGAEVIYSDRMESNKAKKLSLNLSKTLYWTYHKELLGAAEYYKDMVDGIVFLTTFPCGPDALAVTLCQNKISGVPSIIITLDELESRVGLQTRLESFVDVINLRKCRKKK